MIIAAESQLAKYLACCYTTDISDDNGLTMDDNTQLYNHMTFAV